MAIRESSSKRRDANIEDIVALTPVQEGILFHYLKDPGSDIYFVQLCLEITGEIDLRLFREAWAIVIAGNGMLRARFQWQGVKNPLQIVQKTARLNFDFRDVSEEIGAERAEQVRDIMRRDRGELFDLQSVPFRIILCRLQPMRYRLIVSHHHILYDGWSSGIILKEFMAAYEGLVKGQSQVPSSGPGFERFVRWLQARRQKGAQESYWREQLQDYAGGDSLPVKRIDGESMGGTETVSMKFSAPQRRRLADFARRRKITLSVLFYAAWGIILQRYGDSTDVIFGTTVSGRPAEIEGIDSVVGLFINTLPLRLRSHPGQGVGELCLAVARRLRERENFQYASLADIKRIGRLDRDRELFNSLVVVENYPLDHQLIRRGGGLAVTAYSIFETTHYDLTIGIDLFGEMETRYSYKKAAFNPETVAALSRHFLNVLTNMIENPGQPVGQLELLSAEEKDRLLHRFNDTGVDFTAGRTLPELLEEQSGKTPHRCAAGCGERRLSYGALWKRAGSLAHLLRSAGVLPDTIIGLKTERSEELLWAMAGILVVGGAYLLLDPHLPEQRAGYMLADSDAPLLLSWGEERGGCPDNCLLIDLSRLTRTEAAASSPRPNLAGTGLAYVTYTSGSTGRPKGVMVSQAAFVNFIEAISALIPFTGEDRLLSLTAPTFDIFGLETMLPLTRGSGVVIGRRPEQLDAAAALQTMVREGISLFQTTPSRLRLMVAVPGSRRILGSLQYLLVGGEAFPDTLLERVADLPRVRIFNMYGPAETTIWSAVKELSGQTAVTVGGPVANTGIYISGRSGTLQPCEAAGELGISGAGLARGYLNRPELTADKFVPHPFLPGGRLYLTGDLARRRRDGEIEFLCRIDHQVKIRGYRIEPGEIESHLTTHRDVETAVVVKRENRAGDEALCAYYTSPGEIPVPELRRHLLRELPDYMVPSFFIRLNEIPLTASGKADRRALPPPPGERPGLSTSFRKPRTRLEQELASIWSDLLGVDRVGIHDNFFDLGGHSLHLIRLSSRLKQHFDRDVPVVDLFRYPSIDALVNYLSGDAEKDRPGERPHTKMKAAAADPSGPPIAVIGMAGSFPGAADIDEYWENLKNGVESIAFFSSGELEAAGLESRLFESPAYVGAKGVLEGREYFDASFFGYTPKEAATMDPQTRIFHHCAWAALEDAGYDSTAYPGLIGVYAGASVNPYWLARSISPGTAFAEQWQSIQYSDKDFLSTRISYKLNLRGPSLTVHTACSTSLAAVDLACQGLWGRRCHMALAGAVSVTLQDESGYLYQEGLVYSPDGHCRPFDASAGGIVGGNGVGVVVLKPMVGAKADGDHIYALIKGSAANNDGARKVGFTAPSSDGQVEVVRAALERAAVEPETVGYIEAHGSGTLLGDPVEIEALCRAFSTERKGFCAVGSVKANIGHLDAAAGIAGLIKAVLTLRHRLIAPVINCDTPNPRINFEDTPFYLNPGPKPWKRERHPRRAGVSSLGIGGTNVHLVLEEAPPSRNSRAAEQPRLLVLSARTEAALDQAGRNLAAYLTRNPAADPADVAYTLQVGRRSFEYRRLLVCENRQDCVRRFSGRGPSTWPANFTGGKSRFTVFMFPGLGAQYLNMGRDLYDRLPPFREELDCCFEICDNLLDYNIRKILYPHGDAEVERAITGFHSIEMIQPLVFVLELALARLLMRWGVRPQAMIGYSLGEYVAACIAGVFTAPDALALIKARGELVGRLPAGGMLGVPLTAEDTAPLLSASLSIAVDNGPSTVVAGPRQDIDRLVEQLRRRKLLSIRLPGTAAIHSPLMEPILSEFEEKVGGIKLQEPRLPYISNVTGTWISAAEAVDPAYWASHLRSTVRFNDGIKELIRQPRPLFVEVGPGRDLTTLLARHRDSAEPAPDHESIALVRAPASEVSDIGYLLKGIGRLWLYGVDIDWPAFWAHEKRQRLSLPTYPFERRPFPFRLEGPSRETAPELVSGSPGSSGEADIGDWFYSPSWKRSPIDNGTKGDELDPSSWLVFSNRLPLGSRLIKQLRLAGRPVMTVGEGAGFKRRGQGRYVIDPGCQDDYDKLFAELKRIKRLPGTILHLWSVTPAGAAESRITEWEALLQYGFFSLVYIAGAIGKLNMEIPLRLEVVTNGSRGVTGEEALIPEKALLSGAAGVIPLEYPHIRCRLFDVVVPGSGGEPLQRLAGQLLAELAASGTAADIALRGRYRWLPVFERLAAPSPRGMNRLREKGIYLVTGGLGGVGFRLSRYLAEQAAARLVLVGRTQLPPRRAWKEWSERHPRTHPVFSRIEKLEQLEKCGGEVMYEAVDVADRHGMERVITRAETCWGAVDGVIHCAGLGEGGLIQRGSADGWRKMIAAKVDGTRVLDALFRTRKTDFFILCSSIAAVVPTFGQAAYCAANAYLDAFAHYRSFACAGLTLSIDWDRWQGIGVARTAEAQHRDVTGESLSGGMTADQGVEVFDRILSLSLPQVVVSTRDLEARIKENRYLEPGRAVSSTGKAAGVEPSPRPALDCEYILPRDELEKMLAQQWSQVLGFEDLGINDDFFELGGDSLKGIILVNRLKELLGEVIHITMIFDAPTIARQAAYLRKHYSRGAAGFGSPVSLSRGDDDGGAPGNDHIALARRLLVSTRRHRESDSPKNRPALFILSPPRSGSTLLRVILAGHPGLFAPPELNLLSFDTLGQRRDYARAHGSALYHGPIRALMQLRECDFETAEKMMNSFEDQDLGTKQFYHILQQWLGDRLLVDKSPDYSLSTDILERGEIDFEQTRYLHLVRHPGGTIHSFLKARMDLLLKGRFRDEIPFSRRQLAELSWMISHRNILSFLEHIPPHRQLRVRFEDLLRHPRRVTENICRFLDIEFVPGMLDVYGDAGKRMADGVRPEGMMIGDVRFHHHKRIEAGVADHWQGEFDAGSLGEDVRQLADRFGYPPSRETPAPRIRPSEKRYYYPASPVQKRLFVLQQMRKESIAYNVTKVYELVHEGESTRLAAAFKRLIERHEALRTALVLLGGEPVQVVRRTFDVSIRYFEPTAADSTAASFHPVIRRFVRPFDLSAAPLLRVGISKLERGRSLLMVDMHHVVTDGNSLPVFIGDFLTLYSGGLLPPLKFQYRDYALWQQNGRGEGGFSAQEDYWLKELSGLLPVLDLPTDFRRPPLQSLDGSVLIREMDPALTAALNRLARRQGVTLNMVLLAIFYILLARLSGQEDILVGTLVTGRTRPEWQALVGMFVNTLVIRCHPSADRSFKTLLAEVKRKSLAALGNQDYPFDLLVEKIEARRDLSRHPLFDVVFVFQHDAGGDEAGDPKEHRGLQLIPYPYRKITSKFDLLLDTSQKAGTIALKLEYCTGLFKGRRIENFLEQYIKIAEQVCGDSEMKIEDIEMMTAAEVKRVQAAIHRDMADIHMDLDI